MESAFSVRGGDSASSCRAAFLFVSIVEIEEDFSHIAAMAGMASVHVVCSDWRGHFSA
jgi:hypothetical protein